MESDFEILDKYIKEFGLESDLENLDFFEQLLYKFQLRDTLSFSLYLVRYRMLEFLNKFVKH